MFGSGSASFLSKEQAASAKLSTQTATDALPIEAPRSISVELEPPPALPERAQPQRIELDEALRVLLVVGALVVFEGDQRRGIKRGRALASGDDDVALVKLEPHLAFDHLLRLVDQRLQHLALRREPEAIVDELRIARHQLVLEVAGAAVERDRFDGAMRLQQNGAA